MTTARFLMRRRYFGITPVAVARDARARVRTLAFTVGFLAQAVLALAIFQLV